MTPDLRITNNTPGRPSVYVYLCLNDVLMSYMAYYMALWLANELMMTSSTAISVALLYTFGRNATLYRRIVWNWRAHPSVSYMVRKRNWPPWCRTTSACGQKTHVFPQHIAHRFAPRVAQFHNVLLYHHVMTYRFDITTEMKWMIYERPENLEKGMVRAPLPMKLLASILNLSIEAAPPKRFFSTTEPLRTWHYICHPVSCFKRNWNVAGKHYWNAIMSRLRRWCSCPATFKFHRTFRNSSNPL